MPGRVAAQNSRREGEGAGKALIWAQRGFPENKKENRGSPALCVSGNFQGKQRVFGAPFWKLASFPESESWSGAKSEAKLRKSTKYPGGRRVISRYTRVLREIPGILPIWPKIWLILGPNQPQTRLRAKNLTISTQFSRENREEKRGCCREKGKENRRGARGKPRTTYSLKQTGCEGLPAPDPRLGLRPRPRVRRCRRPEAELRLQAKVARCRLSSKKIAM